MEYPCFSYAFFRSDSRDAPKCTPAVFLFSALSAFLAERTLTMENTKNNITINGNVTVNISTSGATASTNEISITENTTLGELLKLLNLGEKPREIPTPKKLRENAGKPIAFYPVSGSVPVENVECTVYSNGFAVYDNGSGRTVLWLPDCTSFTYIFAKPKASEEGMLPYKDQIPDEMLESLSWFTAVTLIGDHRVENNLMNRKSGCSSSINYDAYGYDDKHYADDEKNPYKVAFFWNDGRFGENPLDALIRQERNREMLAAMTDKQREVFLLYYRDGYTQQQIADMLGCVVSMVNKHLSASLKKIKNLI